MTKSDVRKHAFGAAIFAIGFAGFVFWVLALEGDQPQIELAKAYRLSVFLVSMLVVVTGLAVALRACPNPGNARASRQDFGRSGP